MKRSITRLGCFAICMLLCLMTLCACGERSNEAAANTPVAGSTQAEETQVTPTPCAHSFQNGVCTQCGEACTHSWKNGICTVCDSKCEHEFTDTGSCCICGMTCTHPSFEEGACVSCGWICTHPQHDPSSTLCLNCGVLCRHSFINGYCSCGRYGGIVTDKLPEEMHWGVPETGTVEMFEYPTHDYLSEGIMHVNDLWGTKQCAVYLPYGYSESKQYNVLFLSHGAGGSEYDWLVTPHYFEGEEIGIASILDAMIYYGYCEPLIVVGTASSTLSGTNDAAGLTVWRQLYPEVRDDLLPCIVDAYSTYAADSSYINLVTARDHFAFAGLSDGALVTQYAAMMNAYDLFSWFGMYSANDSMDLVMNALNGQWSEFPLNYFFTTAGEFDFQRNNVQTEYAAFCEGYVKVTDGVNGSLAIMEGYKHEWGSWILSLYDTLLLFF